MESNYTVYQHVTPDNMYYFGQTNDIKQRWRCNGIQYKETSLYPYIEKYGWENIQHIVLYENLPYDDALKIEDSLIISGWEKGNCINKRRSGNVSKDDVYIQEYQRDYHQEHYQKNREKELERRRQYYQKNREKELEQKRQYYQKNREKELEQKRQRYQKNREKILEQKREYYQRKKLEKQLKEAVETTLF